MRTETAQAAVDFSAQFTTSFSAVTIGGDYPRTAVLREPEGMSTDGGKRARQALTLVSLEHAGPAMAVGWVNLTQYKASIRTYARLAEMHRQRTDETALGLDKEDYDRFLELARAFFSEYGLTVELEDYAATPHALAEPATATLPWRTVILVTALGALILIAIWRLFL